MPKRPLRKRRRRTGSNQKNFLWVALVVLSGAAVLGLVLWAHWAEEPPASRTSVQSGPPGLSQKTNSLVRLEVETFLASIKLSSRDVRRDLGTLPNRYVVQGEMPPWPILEEFKGVLRKISPLLSATVTNNSSLIISSSGLPLIIVHFTIDPRSDFRQPLVVIIMDDMGRSLHPAEVLLSLKQPVTFAVLPGETYAAEVARMGYEAGREILLHVPMEPQGYPAIKPGEDALLVRYNEAEIRQRFIEFLARVPYVVGANNHMGSRFTEDRSGMTTVMELMRERDLFFVDSLTTGRSRVSQIAKQLNVAHVKRDVFLDNVAEVEAIKGEILKLVNKSKNNGYALGICHPYPETLQALQQTLPSISEKGVEIVTVRTLLKYLDFQDEKSFERPFPSPN